VYLNKYSAQEVTYYSIRDHVKPDTKHTKPDNNHTKPDTKPDNKPDNKPDTKQYHKIHKYSSQWKRWKD
jgi:hypothetical protein